MSSRHAEAGKAVVASSIVAGVGVCEGHRTSRGHGLRVDRGKSSERTLASAEASEQAATAKGVVVGGRTRSRYGNPVAVDRRRGRLLHREDGGKAGAGKLVRLCAGIWFLLLSELVEVGVILLPFLVCHHLAGVAMLRKMVFLDDLLDGATGVVETTVLSAENGEGLRWLDSGS